MAPKRSAKTSTDAKADDGLLARWSGKAGQIAAIVTAITAVSGLIIGVVRPIVHKAHGDRAHLVVDNAVVSNGQEDSRAVGDGSVQTAASTPTIHLTLGNSGHASVYLKAAHVEILDAADFDTCYTAGGGDVPESNPVAIDLPVRPVVPTTVDVPLDKTIDPGQRTTFPLLFGQRDNPAEWGLYSLRVTFTTDESTTPFVVGRYLLSLPGSAAPGEESFPVVPRMRPLDGPGAKYTLAETWCFAYNLSRLRALTALPGDRAPETAALTGTSQTPSFASRADHTPARQAAQRLAVGEREQPRYAVFAAQQTHDAAFVATIRAKALATLLAGTRRALADPDGSALALLLAREARQLSGAADVQQLLGDAERASLAEAARRTQGK